MKNLPMLIATLLLFNCQNVVVEKPKDLIDEDKMITILYDLSLLEAIKGQTYYPGQMTVIQSDFIYEKHKIDSLQFVRSNQYYAADVAKYKRMYNKVNASLKSVSAVLAKNTTQKTLLKTDPKVDDLLKNIKN